MRLATKTLALAPLVFCSACDWFTDFKQQPSVNSWQHFSTDSAAGRGFRGNPAGSVPTTGATVPAYAISYGNGLATLDSFTVIKNPVAADDRSITNGRKYYAINCSVCHGDTGDGNGQIKQLNPMYSFAPPLTAEITKGRTDGYLWGMIRNGRATMPPYNRIEDMDRWDVVNYIRGLQGKLGRTVPTGPAGFPGETGDKLPGATRTGPTIPSAYAKPAAKPEGGR